MEILGAIAGVLALIGYLPQTIKTIRTRQTKDLSYATFCIIGASAVLWTIYGVLKGLPSIYVTNAVIAICTIIIVIVKLSEERKQNV